MSLERTEVVPTSGIWKVAPSDYQTLIARTRGTVTFEKEKLTEGRQLREGQVLMSISSEGLTTGNLPAEIKKAKAELDQAQSEYERKKELNELKIVPKAEFEKAEQRYKVVLTNYQTLTSGYSRHGKQVKVPFDGYIKSLTVNNGAFVEQGAPLLTITSHKSSLLQTWVGASYAQELENLQNIFYMPAEGQWSNLKETGGEITSVGKEIEPDKPQISIFAEVNEAVQMPEGSFTEVQLSFGSPEHVIVIPEEALLEDYGNFSVIIQLSGENFERRPVQTGRRNGKLVEIKNGLTSGEMVVTKGAYQVKMASMSGEAPAHGHAH